METSPIQSRMYGATMQGSECGFRVWAPHAKRMRLRIVGENDYEMQREEDGYFSLNRPSRAGERYFYIPDGNKPVPDPVSRLLPEGVHGPTEIVNPNEFVWSDQGWNGLELRDYILYELHIGTFTPQGTFEGVLERLQYLKLLGITVIELMPVAAFPGERNWGYDGVSPYAVQASYGGPSGLKRLVDAAHAIGIAVILDVVYNHLGNEGNYLRMFGPYFTSHHKTPWGEAINYDGEGSKGVRRYFIENALYWIREYHLDGLRLDAVQTIHDDSPKHILAGIRDKVQTMAAMLGRKVCVIAESDENDARLVRTESAGGYGLNAVWSDDFHHAMHTVLTRERQGYYQDFGDLSQIVRALNQGFVFQGEYFKFWGHERGAPAEDVPLPAHVVCLQNHDQIGNRAEGDRLTALASIGARKMAAALLLLAPETPLLFMGEEYGESAPFQFFTSYADPTLAKAVSQGRRNEFKDFNWNEVPDPQDPATFERSKLNWKLAGEDNEMLRWYRALIALRKKYVMNAERTCKAELLGQSTIVMRIPAEAPRICVLAQFSGERDGWSPGNNWKLALWNDEKDYAVTVSVRA